MLPPRIGVEAPDELIAAEHPVGGHQPQAGSDRRPHRLVGCVFGRLEALADGDQARDRDEEGDRVEAERLTGAEGDREHAAQRRADDPGERLEALLPGVGHPALVLGHQHRDGAASGRVEQGRERLDGDDHDVDHDQRVGVERGGHRYDQGEQGPAEVGDDHQPPALEAVGERAERHPQQAERDRFDDRDGAQLERVVGELEDVERDEHAPGGVADVGDALGAEEDPEVPVPLKQAHGAPYSLARSARY